MRNGDWVTPVDNEDVPDALKDSRAFAPRPLPSDVPLPSATCRLLAEAEHALGRLQERVEHHPARATFVRTSQIRDAQSSAALAGMSVDLVEALLSRLMIEQTTPLCADDGVDLESRKHSDYFARFILASDQGSRRIREGAPLNLTLLGEVSAILTGRASGPAARELREHQGWLGGSGPAPAFLLTTPPGPLLSSSLDQWSLWLEAEMQAPRIVKTALGHLQIELLQPYPAANGHVARLFSSMEMMRSSLLSDPVLLMSTWLDSHREEYQRQLLDYTGGGPPQRWIEFFTRGVRDQALEQLALISALEELREKYRDRATGPPSVRTALSDLVDFPVTNHRRIAENHELSMNTATAVTAHLVTQGFVTSMDHRTYRKVFVCRDVVRLLALKSPLPPRGDAALFHPRPPQTRSGRKES